jgi:hypothetical protein
LFELVLISHKPLLTDKLVFHRGGLIEKAGPFLYEPSKNAPLEEVFGEDDGQIHI